MLTLNRAEILVGQLRDAGLGGEGFDHKIEPLNRPKGQPHEAILTVVAHGGPDSLNRTKLLAFANERADALKDFGVVVRRNSELEKLVVVFE